MMIIKKALLLSALTCAITVVVNYVVLVLDLYIPKGYIRPVNPFGIFMFTYLFFLLATLIYLVFEIKLNFNKWLSAIIGILTVYLLINILLIREDDFIKNLNWWVPIFLIIQVFLLVLIDSIVSKLLIKKKK